MKNRMSESETIAAISQLSSKYSDIEQVAREKNRPNTDKEYRLMAEIQGEISELRAHLDKLKPAGGPSTLQGFGSGADRGTPKRVGTGGRTFEGMFGRAKDRGGFEDVNEYLSVVASGRFDPRLIQATGSETLPSGGGFSVPTQFAAQWLDTALESEIVRPRATVYPMASNSLNIPAWDSATHTSGLVGGLQGRWLAELSTASEESAKLRQIELGAKKLAVYASASNELVLDGISYEQQLMGAMQKSLSFTLDKAFLQGTGAGQPLGVVNDPALVTVPKESGQKSGTVVWENCVKMFARLAPGCMANAVWVANPTVIPQLLTMSLSVGTGGAPIQPSVLQQGDKFYLLGKEVLFTEKAPALGSAGQIMLCDFSQYAIGLRKEMSLDKSIHVGWTQDYSAYRVIIRVDGMGTWDKPITPASGDTLSWAVALAA